MVESEIILLSDRLVSCKGAFTLDLAEVTRLTVHKAEDRSLKGIPCQYELNIHLSEKSIESAKKSGFVFKA